MASSGTQPLYGYQGSPTDPITKLVDMGTRMYAPSLGRFTTRDILTGDPLHPISLNQFVYGADSPVTMWDPTGMKSLCETCEHKENQGQTEYVACRANTDKGINCGYAWANAPTIRPAPPAPKPPAPAASALTGRAAMAQRVGANARASRVLPSGWDMIDGFNAYFNPAYWYLDGCFGSDGTESMGSWALHCTMGSTALVTTAVGIGGATGVGAEVPDAAGGELRPPGYDPDKWESGPASRMSNQGRTWRDPQGGEWGWHAPDPHHNVGHWDYNPWETWNSPWRRVYPGGI